MFSAALFWADKAATLSHFDPRDVYQLASCMFLLKQYQRAVVLIKNKGLDKVRIIIPKKLIGSFFKIHMLYCKCKYVNTVDCR